MSRVMPSSKKLLTRRRVLAAGAGALVLPPVAAAAVLKIQDNPLPPVSDPQLVLVNMWLLEAGDLSAEQQ